MGMVSKTIAVATAVVGYDLMSGEAQARESVARVINSVGMTGSAAAGDCEVELLVNGKSVGKFINTNTGLAVKPDTDHKLVDEFVPPNALVQAIVRDAPGTNDIRFEVLFSKPQNRGGYRYSPRRTYRGGGRNYGGTRSYRRNGMY